MTNVYKIAVLPGDGIGPEVVEAALTVLDAVQDAVKGLRLEYLRGEAGYHCIAKYGTNLPAETLEMLKETSVCLKGPMTTPEEPGSPVSVAVTIRKLYDLYANIRPCKTLPGVAALKPDIDLIILRENTEGFYFAKEVEIVPGVAVALRLITRKACERIARCAFNLASKRKKLVTYVHKGNILKLTDGIFKQAVLDVAKEYPEVAVEEQRIDAMAMQLIKRPETFDVVVTTNMFGDILSDEAAQLVGGLGFAAGANVGDTYGMFEPVHGSAPKYAGKNKVNPLATILAAKMMLDHLGEGEAAERVEKAVLAVLTEGKTRTYDLGGNATTSEMAEAIAAKILGQEI
ncbi:isocitrate/isopropylmalate dehydrogenase family protein [Candidatus Hecatella orcuttiae]|jgi:isopropylmalate/isohomocitrate dehydrogenase-like protein|uniref:isocitrate/isopropylmalate dehydrogenase family protein n=1 Tax=Candidatus Hecatella orcuttiae TaxID=1935119 RepID=UPI002867DF5E|nr:isocitrate/isopropylmalate dehydrogenase family protein [Candidatus Hecatella orcuttiae]